MEKPMKKFSISSTALELSWEVDLQSHAACNGISCKVDATRLPDGRVHVLVNGHSFIVSEEQESGRHRGTIRNRTFLFTLETAESKLIRTTLGAKHGTQGVFELRAPMPGLVSRCEVSESQEVKTGDGLLILEAMKMENELKSPLTGKITKLSVKEKEAVEKGQLLLTITQRAQT
jgi:biotin carboxyl carrier protein